MKLYTEQQLRYIYNCYDFNLDQDGGQIIDENKHFEQCIKTLTPIELPNHKEQLDRIEKLLLSEEIAKRNRFKIGPL